MSWYFHFFFALLDCEGTAYAARAADLATRPRVKEPHPLAVGLICLVASSLFGALLAFILFS